MEQLHVVKDGVRQVVWSLAVQGVFFVVLAVLILVYPALLVVLAAVMFGLMGLTLLAMAVRLNGLWRKLPAFIRDAK